MYESCDTQFSNCQFALTFITFVTRGKRDKLVMVRCQSVVSLEVVGDIFAATKRTRIDNAGAFEVSLQ